MKSVLISIQPQWVEKIVNREKTIEVRKTAPKEVPFKAYIYCIKEKKQDDIIWAGAFGDRGKWNGHIIGEFICDRIDRIKKRGINNNFDYCYLSLNEWGNDDIEIEIKDIQKSCISKSELNAYGENSSCLYAWHISDLKIYGKPKELSEFYTIPESGSDCCCGCVWYETQLYEMPCRTCTEERKYLYRPPQSWQYVEELK